MSYKIIEYDGMFAIQRKTLFGEPQLYNYKGMFTGWYGIDSFHALKMHILFSTKEEAVNYLKLMRGKL